MTPPTPRPGWDDAPCALLMLDADGRVLEANRTLLEWIGSRRDEIVGSAHLSRLLSVGGRIYWETHLAPLLHVEGRVDEVALELKAPSGRLPVLLTAVVRRASDGTGDVIHVALSSAGERTRYERELLAARRAADRSAATVQLLQSATSALSQALGVTAVADAVLSAVGPLGAAGTLWLTDGDRGLVLHGARGEPAHAVAPAGLLLTNGVAVESAGRLVVPLHGSAALQGVLSLAPRSELGAEPLDVDMLTTVGQQAGLALDRAHLYEHSAGVARELQHALLAVDPPRDDRFAVATSYRPGVEMLEVGGDWYDVFLAADGMLAVVVGDVVGRGLAAASAMGQLRSAVRAVAAADMGPAQLLSRLDRFVDQVPAAAMATVAYAELDLETGRLRYACAGHPPPLLLPARGVPHLLWEGRSTPLGAYLGDRHRAEAEVQLHPGDRVLLFTDGLFERRDRSLDEGLQLLSDTATDLGDLPLRSVVASLTRQLLRDEVVRDDVCVLLLAWAGSAFERRLPADLTALAAVRRALAGWLIERGVDEDARRDLVLAASEALANAAEHGSGGRSSEQVTLRARVERPEDGAEEVVVLVEDSGNWIPTVESAERGRGLTIMSALVDEVVLGHGEGTTVTMRRKISRRPA